MRRCISALRSQRFQFAQAARPLICRQAYFPGRHCHAVARHCRQPHFALTHSVAAPHLRRRPGRRLLPAAGPGGQPPGAGAGSASGLVVYYGKFVSGYFVAIFICRICYLFRAGPPQFITIWFHRPTGPGLGIARYRRPSGGAWGLAAGIGRLFNCFATLPGNIGWGLINCCFRDIRRRVGQCCP